MKEVDVYSDNIRCTGNDRVVVEHTFEDVNHQRVRIGKKKLTRAQYLAATSKFSNLKKVISYEP